MKLQQLKQERRFVLLLVFSVLSACGKTAPTVEQILTIDDDDAAINADPISTINGEFGDMLNLEEVVDHFRVGEFHKLGFRGQGIKIAILDNGFADFEKSRGVTIPSSTAYDKNSHNPPAVTRHGTSLAELVYKVATGNQTVRDDIQGPELFLYNSNGFSNFEESVDKAIAQGVDVILYAQVWEYGGNFDGEGFINSVVDRATAAGILWINAAGNFHRKVWSGPVSSDSKDNLYLGNQTTELSFRVTSSSSDVKIAIAWNDFTNSQDYATTQDLDLTVVDDSGNEVKSSSMRQSGSSRKDDSDWSAHAREIVKAELPAGTYGIRIKNQSKNFSMGSMVRAMVQGIGVDTFSEYSANSILIPADNPSVITVGALDFEFSSQSPSKPDLFTASTVNFAGGKFVRGTSTAAAFTAAALAVKLSRFGPLSREQAIDSIAP